MPGPGRSILLVAALAGAALGAGPAVGAKHHRKGRLIAAKARAHGHVPARARVRPPLLGTLPVTGPATTPTAIRRRSGAANGSNDSPFGRPLQPESISLASSTVANERHVYNAPQHAQTQPPAPSDIAAAQAPRPRTVMAAHATGGSVTRSRLLFEAHVERRRNDNLPSGPLVACGSPWLMTCADASVPWGCPGAEAPGRRHRSHSDRRRRSSVRPCPVRPWRRRPRRERRRTGSWRSSGRQASRGSRSPSRAPTSTQMGRRSPAATRVRRAPL